MPIRILYLTSSSNLWGARRSLLDILKFIDRKKFSPFVIIPGEGRIEEELKRFNIPYKIIYFAPWRKANRFFQRKESLKNLKEFVEKNPFDLIHANSHFVAPYGIEIGERFKIPVISHIRDILSPDKVRKYLLDKSNVIICNSLTTREVFKQLPPEKIKVIYNGIDTEYFSPQPSEKIKAWRKKWGLREEPLVGYIGKISREKGADSLLKIIPGVLKEIPEAKFLIAGEVRRERDEDLVKELQQYKEKVVLTGWVNELPIFYSSIEALFFPTRKESFGRVAVESLCCETPVVASNIGGVREIIENESSGFLFSQKNLVEGKDRLVYILRHREIKEKMGKKGREEMKERFNIHKIISKIEDIYKNIQ
ncbi:glycosyltransferase family 4 protein [Candidatus Calescamantes bacterium]|nr:glycosyltransferase family 4 protein [Candidatus Calescamantes bacterium]